MKNWLIGCSGFSYKEWRDRFYPKGVPQRLWFEYYCKHFNTLELNVTFYRFPQLAALLGWHKKAPDGFVFSAKVPRSITHYKKFEGTEQLVADFYKVIRDGLQEKLGAVLFQLPPQTVYSEDKLQKILRQVDPSFTNVIEFRHSSWWRQDVIDQLARNNISFCGVSFPKIPYDDAVVNIPVVYYRFHGVPVLFYSEYDTAFLEKIVMQISEKDLAQTVYLYFNNTASMAAIGNAQYVQQRLQLWPFKKNAMAGETRQSGV